MATTAVSSQPSHYLTAQTQTKNFIDRLAQTVDLNEAENREFYKTVWNVAATTTIVAFFALSGLGLVATAVYAAESLTVASIVILLSMRGAFSIRNGCLSYASENEGLAEFYRGVVAEGDQLPKDRSGIINTMIGKILNPYGNSYILSGDATRLLPAMSRYQYWSKQAENQEKLALKHKLEALSTDYTEEGRYKIQLTSLQLTEKSLESKIKAAFFRFVIMNPDFKGELADLCEIYDSRYNNYKTRAIANECGNTQGARMFQLKNSKREEFTVNELKSLSHEELARRFASVATAR